MDFFTPITNAECVLPPKTGGRKSRVRRSYKGGKSKMHSKYHNTKHTRKDRITRRRK